MLSYSTFLLSISYFDKTLLFWCQNEGCKHQLINQLLNESPYILIIKRFEEFLKKKVKFNILNVNICWFHSTDSNRNILL